MKRVLIATILVIALTAGCSACGETGSDALPPVSDNVLTTDDGGGKISAELAGQLDGLGSGETLLFTAVINTDAATVIPTLPEGMDVSIDAPKLYLRGTRDQIVALGRNPYIDDLLPIPAGIVEKLNELFSGFALTVYRGQDDPNPIALSESRLAGQEELARFYEMLSSLPETILSAEAGVVPDDVQTSGSCGAGDSVRLLGALCALSPEVLDTMQNPDTGGAVWVHVQTETGSFAVSCPGTLLFVSVEGEDAAWIFGISPENDTANKLWGVVGALTEQLAAPERDPHSIAA